MTLHTRDRDALLHTYSRLPVEIVRGEGMYLVDNNDRRYLDFFGGLAVNALGYGHPAILDAIETQTRKYIHLSNLFPQQPQVELAEMLREQSGLDAVFFANSGAESLEAAFKLLRRWGADRGKTELIAFSGGFHARTMAGLSMMDVPKYRDRFGPFLQNCHVIPFNDPEALRAAVHDNTIAVVFEPIQGEGGVLPLSMELADTLRQLRDQYGILLVADEIQCGMGRTGSFLASAHFDLEPDVVTLAKSLGGGLPLSALLVGRSLREVLGPGDHGSTFGGNPVACAAGIAVLRELSGGLLENAAAMGKRMHNAFMDLQMSFPAHIEETRGLGCMQALVCTRPAAALRDVCLEQRLLVNVTREKVLRFLPPLILSEEDVDTAIAILRRAFESWEIE